MRAPQGIRERVNVAGRDDEALDAVDDAFRPAAGSRGDHGNATTHGFLHGQTEAIRERRKHQHIGRRVFG